MSFSESLSVLAANLWLSAVVGIGIWYLKSYIFHKVHIHLPFILRLDLSAIGTLELVLDHFIGAARNVYFSRYPLRLHAGGDIDRVSPDIVREFLGADNAGHHWSGVDPET